MQIDQEIIMLSWGHLDIPLAMRVGFVLNYRNPVCCVLS